jgi:HEAT repeat protein
LAARAIPELVKVLKNQDRNIKLATIHTFVEISIHSRYKQGYQTSLMLIAVELREELSVVIPSLVDLLKDGRRDVRSAVVSGLVSLSKHGEFD